MRMREDVALLKNNPDVQHGLQEHISDITSENGHRRAFISVCKTIRRHQDLPEIPPNVIARRAFDVPQCNLSEDDELQQQIAWVESTIQQRLPGWRSCVKLKLQFFAVFEESAINAGFADLICACDLHWELCTVLCRYLRRHRTDPARLSFETFQMGCELLLAVFSKKEQLQCQLRDYLYMKSRLICKNVNDPLFGSWELWRLNIDIQLIATLNQLVATKSSTVPQSTIEALIKISLIAPYQVIAKIVHNAFVNRGQCSILIQLLVNSGQLPWLRTDSKAPTLLVSVIHDILCEPDSEITVYNQDQHRNFVDFVLKATSTENRHGQVVINPTEFLVGCAAPLLARMIGGEKSTFFRSVTGILMKMYGWKSTALLVNGDWFDHQIHLRILLQLLQLRTMESAWTADQIDSRFQVPGSGRQGFEHKGRGGGEHMEDVSGLCERLVSRMSSHIGSMDINMQTGNDVADVISRTLEQSIPLLDLESQLVLVPLLSACRQHLDTDLPLPALPPTISLLCQDHLNTFNYQGSSEFSGKQDLSTALFLVLDVARMCEETMAEITWALGAATIISQTDEEYLGQIFVPVLYRVLSISSRSEGCRLLTKGAPRMILFWSGLPDLSFYWDVVDVQEVMKKPLGPYWDSFTQAGYHRQGTREAKSKFTVLGYQDILLLVLHVSEMLLRFSLEPLPPKGTELVLDAFRLELGYDVMIDQVASLILSSIRSLSIDWVTIPTDLVLYCFMAVSKMSYIAANLHTEKIFSNRLRPHSVFAAKANTAWTRDYTRFMRQTDTDLEQQERIARSKARDELVLTAMNISEEIVRRHDLHYKLNVKDNQGVPKDEQSSKSQGESRDTESRILELDNGYQNKDRLSSSGFGTGRGSDGMDEGTKAWFASIAASTPRVESTDRGEVVINIVVVDSKASDIDSDKEVSNNALSGALKTEASDEAKPGGNEAKEGELPSRPSVPALLMTPQQQDDREEPSTPVPAASDLGLTQATVEKPDVLRLLSPDQVDCLVLALKLLPAQEQQAVRARLFRLLEKDDDNLSV
ncbi:hypothetical protein BGZ54_004387 [Gamsiella multidivaricata]|nr:hypothetical protein BGZ54_004387 [Gamsiella multidivaricata]